MKLGQIQTIKLPSKNFTAKLIGFLCVSNLLFYFLFQPVENDHLNKTNRLSPPYDHVAVQMNIIPKFELHRGDKVDLWTADGKKIFGRIIFHKFENNPSDDSFKAELFINKNELHLTVRNEHLYALPASPLKIKAITNNTRREDHDISF